MTEDWRRPALCSRTGGPLHWTCLGVRKKGGIYTVKCPDCAPKSKRCDICGRLLDQPDDPDSLDCGGDCWACVREAEQL